MLFGEREGKREEKRMPEFKTATTFELYSVDHGETLLNNKVHSTRKYQFYIVFMS